MRWQWNSVRYLTLLGRTILRIKDPWLLSTPSHYISCNNWRNSPFTLENSWINRIKIQWSRNSDFFLLFSPQHESNQWRKNVLIPSLDISKVILSSRLRLSISVFYVILNVPPSPSFNSLHCTLSSFLWCEKTKKKDFNNEKRRRGEKGKASRRDFLVHFCNFSTVTKKKLHLQPQKRRMRFVWFQIQIRCSLRARLSIPLSTTGQNCINLWPKFLMLLSKHTANIWKFHSARRPRIHRGAGCERRKKKESEISWPWKLLLLLFSSPPEKQKISHFFRAGFSSPFTFIFSARVLLFFCCCCSTLSPHPHTLRASWLSYLFAAVSRHIKNIYPRITHKTENNKSSKEVLQNVMFPRLEALRLHTFFDFSVWSFSRVLDDEILCIFLCVGWLWLTHFKKGLFRAVI